jgi:hypothetical protein
MKTDRPNSGEPPGGLRFGSLGIRASERHLRLDQNGSRRLPCCYHRPGHDEVPRIVRAAQIAGTGRPIASSAICRIARPPSLVFSWGRHDGQFGPKLH